MLAACCGSGGAAVRKWFVPVDGGTATIGLESGHPCTIQRRDPLMTPDETRDFLTEMFGQIGDRFDGMELRFDRVDGRLDKLESDVGQLKTDVRRLEGKVDQVVRENGVLIDAVADINRRLG